MATTGRRRTPSSGPRRRSRRQARSRMNRRWAAPCSAAARATRSSSTFPPAPGRTSSSRAPSVPAGPPRAPAAADRGVRRRRATMDWADELAASVSGPQVVNDSKTPSGTVHVGSLRGPVILDVIARARRARGLETHVLYGFDDLDPMDAQALLTPDAVDHEM